MLEAVASLAHLAPEAGRKRKGHNSLIAHALLSLNFGISIARFSEDNYLCPRYLTKQSMPYCAKWPMSVTLCVQCTQSNFRPNCSRIEIQNRNLKIVRQVHQRVVRNILKGPSKKSNLGESYLFLENGQEISEQLLLKFYNRKIF